MLGHHICGKERGKETFLVGCDDVVIIVIILICGQYLSHKIQWYIMFTMELM